MSGKPRVHREEVEGAELRAWTFCVEGRLTDWDWSDIHPDPRTWLPTRRVRSGAMSRHVPVQAHCVTTGGTVVLESGLEHELLCWLDRRAGVSWLVAQPCELHWAGTLRHTPDLASVDGDGRVTLWDVKPAEGRDEDFEIVASRTAEACEAVGWDYQIFEGLPLVASLNVRWLQGARRPPEWVEGGKIRLRDVIKEASVVGDVVAADDAAGHLMSVMWHLVWLGELGIDLHVDWTEKTPVRWLG